MPKKMLLTVLTGLVMHSAALAGGAGAPNTAQPFVWPAAWSDAKPGEAKYGGTFHDSNYSPMTFNPFTDVDVYGPTALMGGSGLLIENPRDRSFLPYMAAAQPQVSADGRVYTVTLRRGMKFSDGTPVSARDFITTWQLHADPKMQSGATAFFTVEGQPVTFRAISDDRLQVTFTQPTATASRLLALPVWPARIFAPVYAKGGAEAVKKLWGKDTRPGDIVTAGPWTLAENTKGKGVVFGRNAFWGEWNRDSQGRALPYLERVSWKAPAEDDGPDVPGLISGRYDRITPFTGAEVREVQAAIQGGKLKARLLSDIGVRNSVVYLTFNFGRSADPVKQALFRSAKFRQAVSHMIDREKLVKDVLGGLGVPMYSGVPLMHPAFIPTDLPKYPYDLAAAKRLLAELGYTEHDAEGYLVKDGRRLSFEAYAFEGELNRQYLGVLIEGARAAGVEVTLRTTKDYDALIATLTGDPKHPENRDFDLIMEGNAGFDPVWPFDGAQLTCAGVFHTANIAGQCVTLEEQTVQNLYQSGQRELDPARRVAAGQALNRAIVGPQLLIPLVSANYNLAYSTRLGGALPHALMNAYFRDRLLPLTFIK